MNLFEFYKLAKDNLLDARLQQVANFLAEQNDTTSVVSIVHNLIKVDYKNSPYFERNKQFWCDIETPLGRITPKEFTVNPLKSDSDFMDELKFEYDNRFNTEGNRIKKYFGNSPYHAISGKGKSTATFDNCKTLGDCQKKAKALGIIKPEYSPNDIEQIIAYHINDSKDSPKTRERIMKWLVDTEQILLNTENIKTQGDKND
jgi:hypothetical protein